MEPDDGGDPICSHCYLRFTDDTNLGTWLCRYHPQPANPITGRYPCCGFIIDAKQRLGPRALDSIVDSLGCRRCDHALTPGDPRIVLARSYLPSTRAARAVGEPITNYAEFQRLATKRPELAGIDAATYARTQATLDAVSCLDPELYLHPAGILDPAKDGPAIAKLVLQHATQLRQDGRIVMRQGVPTTLSALVAWSAADGWTRLTEFMSLLAGDTTAAGAELRDMLRLDLRDLVHVRLIPIFRAEAVPDLRSLANARMNHLIYGPMAT